jgi:hypothetical protein
MYVKYNINYIFISQHGSALRNLAPNSPTWLHARRHKYANLPSFCGIRNQHTEK